MSKQYKVFEISKCTRGRIHYFDIHIFTVGIDRNWRRVVHDEDVPFPKMYDDFTIQFCQVNGRDILHWVAENMFTGDYLFSFDLNEGNVLPIQPPVGLLRNGSTRSAFLNGCLCLLHKNVVDNMEIWCLTDFMDQYSWTCRIIPLSGLPGQIRLRWFHPVAHWKNKEEILMIKKPGCIFSCNVEQRIFNKLMLGNTLPNYSSASCFVPNFESVLGTGTTPTKTLDPMNVPHEIAVAIFCRLPVDMILVCKLVSKAWCRFLSNPYFSKDYFNRAVHFILLDRACLRFVVELKIGARQFSRKDPLLLNTDNTETNILGSSNGVLCVSTKSELVRRIFVCNILLGQVAFLPNPEEIKDDAFGFGYSPLTGYKVLRLFRRNMMSWQAQATVHTIGCDEGWRKCGKQLNMPRILGFNMCRFCEVPSNRSINWIGEDCNAGNCIYAFGINDEIVRDFPLPPGLTEINENTCLFLLRHNLGVFHPQPQNILHLWCLNGYGSCWTREIMSLNHPAKPIFPVLSCGDEELLLWAGTLMISYCSRERRFTEINIDVVDDNEFVAVPYMPSFVSLKTIGHLEF